MAYGFGFDGRFCRFPEESEGTSAHQAKPRKQKTLKKSCTFWIQLTNLPLLLSSYPIPKVRGQAFGSRVLHNSLESRVFFGWLE